MRSEQPRFASYSFPLTSMDARYEPGVLRCETGIGVETLSALSARGHHFEDWGDATTSQVGSARSSWTPNAGRLPPAQTFAGTAMR